MSNTPKDSLIPDDIIIGKIYIIRNQKVMIDSDLAILYQVETKRLNEQVNRNQDRFPEDFMFQLTTDEFENLKSQIATSSWGGRRKLPYAFTENGVAMLSGVLNSPTAINVNIQIIRIFTKMRELLLTHKDILIQLSKMEKRIGNHDEQISLIFRYLKELLTPPQSSRRRIGFRRKDETD